SRNQKRRRDCSRRRRSGGVSFSARKGPDPGRSVDGFQPLVRLLGGGRAGILFENLFQETDVSVLVVFIVCEQSGPPEDPVGLFLVGGSGPLGFRLGGNSFSAAQVCLGRQRGLGRIDQFWLVFLLRLVFGLGDQLLDFDLLLLQEGPDLADLDEVVDQRGREVAALADGDQLALLVDERPAGVARVNRVRGGHNPTGHAERVPLVVADDEALLGDGADLTAGDAKQLLHSAGAAEVPDIFALFGGRTGEGECLRAGWHARHLDNCQVATLVAAEYLGLGYRYHLAND